jgi:hypothetical protein
MNDFFEFFIERLLWLWLPLYALYRVLKDVIADLETPEEVQP